jgi:hypothetical protein
MTFLNEPLPGNLHVHIVYRYILGKSKAAFSKYPIVLFCCLSCDRKLLNLVENDMVASFLLFSQSNFLLFGASTDL